MCISLPVSGVAAVKMGASGLGPALVAPSVAGDGTTLRGYHTPRWNWERRGFGLQERRWKLTEVTVSFQSD